MKTGSSAFLSPLAAAATLAVAWLLKLAGDDLAAGGPAATWWPLVAVPAPLVVAVLWGWAAWGDRNVPRLAASAAGWVAAGYLLLGAGETWQSTANVAAGVLAGLAWRRAWRLDVSLALVTGALAPLIIWAAVQMPVREQLAAIGEQSLKVLESQAPPGTDPAELAKAREIGRQRFAKLTDATARVYPSLVALGVLGQAALTLLLVRLLGRARGLATTGRRLPPFAQWRLPFYVVWALVAGIGLLVTRRAPFADAGMNVVVVTASLLSVQGLAVQFHLSRRLLPPPMLIVYWTLMGLAFVPLVVTSVVLGLADQWRDLRRLDPGGTAAGGS